MLGKKLYSLNIRLFSAVLSLALFVFLNSETQAFETRFPESKQLYEFMQGNWGFTGNDTLTGASINGNLMSTKEILVHPTSLERYTCLTVIANREILNRERKREFKSQYAICESKEHLKFYIFPFKDNRYSFQSADRNEYRGALFLKEKDTFEFEVKEKAAFLDVIVRTSFSEKASRFALSEEVVMHREKAISRIQLEYFRNYSENISSGNE